MIENGASVAKRKILSTLRFFINSQLKVPNFTDALEVSSVPGKNHRTDLSG